MSRYSYVEFRGIEPLYEALRALYGVFMRLGSKSVILGMYSEMQRVIIQ